MKRRLGMREVRGEIILRALLPLSGDWIRAW